MRQSPRAGSKRQGAGYWIRKNRIEGCGAQASSAGRSLERGDTAKGRGRGHDNTSPATFAALPCQFYGHNGPCQAAHGLETEKAGPVERPCLQFSTL